MGKLATIFIFYIYFFMPYLLGFDPGRDKCGVAVVESFREDISLESYQVRQHQVFLAFDKESVCLDVLGFLLFSYFWGFINLGIARLGKHQ